MAGREKFPPEEEMAKREKFLPEEQKAGGDIDKTDSDELTTSSMPASSSKFHLDEQSEIMLEEEKEEHETDVIESEELAPQNLVKLLHLVQPLMLILALVACVIFGSEGMVVGFVGTLETRILILVMVLDLLLVWLCSTRSTFPDLKTSLRTVAVVHQAYALLITLNRKYIEIAIIPFSIFAFIYAFASRGSKYECEDVDLNEMATIHYLFKLPLVVWTQYKGLVTLWKGLTDSAKELMIMAAAPYLLQLGLVVWSQYMGQLEEGYIFIFSSFLLFLCSALCALTVMIASSPSYGASHGVDQVLPAMHKTCIVMLMLTAHSMASEWLGEDIIFACMPELISVLVWFSIHSHHPEHEVIINTVTSHRSLAIVLASFGAILVCITSLYAEDGIILRSWFLWVFFISSSSSALSYIDVWLLDRWPDGSTPNSRGGLVQLLKFSLYIGFCVSAIMLYEAFPHYRRQAFSHYGRQAIKYIAIAEEYFLALNSPIVRSILVIILTIVLPMATLLFLLTTQRKENRVEMQEVALPNGDNAATATTANDRHINKDLFGFSTQYSDDYDATATIADDFYERQSRVTKYWNKAAPIIKPQLTGLYEKDQQAKCFEEMLSDEGSNRREVVCIFGAAGSGKEELALEVYHQSKGQFDYHLQVSVGEKPDMTKLIKDMKQQVLHCSDEEKKMEQVLHCSEEEKMMEQALNSLAEVLRLEKQNMAEQAHRPEKEVMPVQVDSQYIGAVDADNVNQLIESLRKLLHKKRYLAVLGDLWSNNDWKTIESCFPQEDTGSRIIISTQFEDVAKAAGDHFYWIPVPVEAEVERLFSEKNSESLSGVFTSKPHRNEDSFERSGEHWKELEQMKQLIRVRYNDLSAHLRACLLYLSLFPENHEVKIELLVRLWLKDWLIRGHNAPFTKETARSYIDELIARKLIEKSSHDHEGTLTSCTVHPLIHEFIVCQATENEFVSLVHAKEPGVLPNTIRWISLENKRTKPAGIYATYLSQVRSVTALLQRSNG